MSTASIWIDKFGFWIDELCAELIFFTCFCLFVSLNEIIMVQMGEKCITYISTRLIKIKQRFGIWLVSTTYGKVILSSRKILRLILRNVIAFVCTITWHPYWRNCTIYFRSIDLRRLPRNVAYFVKRSVKTFFKVILFC